MIGSKNTFSDSFFKLYKGATVAVKAVMSLASLSVTRTFTWPDKDGTVAMTSDIVTVNPDFSDADLKVHSNATPTKRVKFNVTAVAPSTDRTITVPDRDVDLGNVSIPEFADNIFRVLKNTALSIKAIFDLSALSANHTYSLPNKDGTFAMTSDLTGGTGVTVTSGATAPSSVPAKIGDIYVQTGTVRNFFGATGNTLTTDWAYLGSALSGTFTAATVAGLVSWYDASNPVNFVKDGGNNVTTWYDNSGTGKTLVNTPATKPVYTANVQNGLPALYFGGSTYISSNTFTAIGGARTYFVAFKPTSWTSGSGNQRVISCYRGDSTSMGFQFSKFASNVLCFVDNIINSFNNGSLTNTTPVLATIVQNDTSSSIKINDTAPTSGTLSLANIVNIMLGAQAYTATEFFTGYIFEQLTYTGALSTDNQLIIRTYINNKWALW